MILSTVLLVSMLHCSAFVTKSPHGIIRPPAKTTPLTVRHLIPTDAILDNSFNTAVVEVFDGSGIDPVVVSDVFWTRLQGNFLSVIIGNFLAAIVFAFIMSQASAQLSRLGSFVTENIFKSKMEAGGGRASTTFIRADASPTPNVDFGKLIVCIAIDVIGSASELVPVLGEVTDVVWAPIAGLVLRSIFDSNVVFALEFAEEILPFTDIIPLATLCWVVDTFFSDSDLAKALSLGKFNQSINGSNSVIDVAATSERDRLLQGDSEKKSR